MFGSSTTAAGGCPGSGAADWNLAAATPLTTVLAQYTSTVFADSLLNSGGGTSYEPDNAGAGLMFADSQAGGYGSRALCYRVILPQTTANTDEQIIQVIVTAE